MAAVQAVSKQIGGYGVFALAGAMVWWVRTLGVPDRLLEIEIRLNAWQVLFWFDLLVLAPFFLMGPRIPKPERHGFAGGVLEGLWELHLFAIFGVLGVGVWAWLSGVSSVWPSILVP